MHADCGSVLDDDGRCAKCNVIHKRPLHAHVAERNAASIRVLEKCGFTRCGEPLVAPDGITELHLELGAGASASSHSRGLPADLDAPDQRG
jgi:hypothetical protein